MKNNNGKLSSAENIVFYMLVFISGMIVSAFGFVLSLILMTDLSNPLQQSESEKQKTDLSYIVKNAPALNVISITKNSNGSTNTVFDFNNSEYDDSNKKLIEEVIKCGSICYQRVIGEMNNSDYYNHVLKAYKIDDGVNIDHSLKDTRQLSNSEALALTLSRCGTSCLLDSHLFRILISPDFYEQGLNNYIGNIVDADEIARKAYLQDMTVLKEAAIICRDKPELCTR